MDRLLSERRITATDVDRYLRDLTAEVADLERQLAALRGAAGREEAPRMSAATPRPTSPQKRARKVKAASAPSAARQLQGRYMGFYRQIPANKRAKFSKLRSEKGVEAAITAMRRQLGK
jgi:hypothetical protein